MIEKFINELAERNLFLVRKDEKLVLRGAKGQLSKLEIEFVRANEEISNFINGNREELLQYLQKTKPARLIYKLSPLQQGMLFHELFDSSTKIYNSVTRLDFPEGLDIIALKEALAKVLEKHSILRTGFITDHFDVPVQEVYHNVTLPFREVDFRGASEVDINKFISQEQAIAFDLRKPPLLRFCLLRTGEHSYILVWVYHHIIMDGWSIPVFFNEINEYYTNGTAVTGADEPDNYEDYIRYLSTKDISSELYFWKNYLKGNNGPTLLPFVEDNAKRNKGSQKGQKKSHVLDKVLVKAIKHYCQENGVTLNTLFQGVWAYLLNQYTGLEKPVFGVVVSGRSTDIKNIESRVGLYVNTLPLQVDCMDHQPLRNWLQAIQNDNARIRENDGVTINQIQQEIQVSHDLFDTIMVFQNYPNKISPDTDSKGLRISDVATTQYTNYPLTVSISAGETIEINYHYHEQLLQSDYVTMIMKHFINVLGQIIARENTSLQDLRVLTDEETAELGNFSISPEKGGRTILDFFEENVRKNPSAIAIVSDYGVYTYAELNEKANRLANHLLANFAISSDTIVPVVGGRTPWYVVSVLGVLKTGSAFMPVDATLPEKRIMHLLEEVQPQLLIVDPTACGILWNGNFKVVTIDNMAFDFQGAPDNPMRSNSSESLAYIIHTSGSTGEAKGIMIENRSLINYCQWHVDYYGMDSGSRSAMYCSVGFDASVLEIFPPLVAGGSLFIMGDDEIRLNIKALENFIITKALTHIYLPSKVCMELVENNACFDAKIATGGETLTIAKKTTLNIYNNYGPAETTIIATAYAIPTGFIGKPPIGRPGRNVGIYILNKKDQPVPSGVAGEICIAGTCLARGYLNKPALTDAKFVVNDRIESNGLRIYKTGDWGKWDRDGDLIFLGREDSQIKIRGHRVELGAIEFAILSSSYATGCYIIDNVRGDHHEIVAFVVMEASASAEMLFEVLKSSLPSYMIPARIIKVDMLILNRNGKVDKDRMLQLLDSHSSITGSYIAPTTEQEQILCSIWGELLALEQIGINDNFFELGGHSLLATRVLSKVKAHFGKTISIRDVFNHPTIAGLCEVINHKEASDAVLNKLIDLEDESSNELDFSINKNNHHISAAKNVLLTGATGFIGCYVLKELLDRSPEATIYCLIRSADLSEGRRRIVENLKYYKIYKEAYSKRILPVSGDLSIMDLGMQQDTYNDLVQKIDHIFHLATHMDHFSSFDKLKDTNVRGNVEIIRFSITGRNKKIIYASTLGSSSQKSLIVENDSRDQEVHYFGAGYSATKWVGENIMKKAISEGLDIQIHRIGLVTGDKITGIMPKEQWFARLLESCCQLRAYSEDFAVPIVPVDFVAQAMVEIALNTGHQEKFFHLCNRNLISLKAIFSILPSYEKFDSLAVQLLLERMRNTEEERLSILPFISQESTFGSPASKDDDQAGMHCNKRTMALLGEISEVRFPDLQDYFGKYLTNAMKTNQEENVL